MSELLDIILDFESCGEDIAKLDPSVSGNEEWIQKYSKLRECSRRIATNCEEIIDLSENILQNKTRDLRIADYLCRALLHQKGFKGLAEGLAVYHSLLSNMWDKGLHPQLVPARTNNIILLDKNLAQDIELKKDAETDRETLEEIKKTIEQIMIFLQEKIPDRKVLFENAGSVISKMMSAMKPQSPPVSKPSESPRPGTASAARPAPTVTPDAVFANDLDAIRALIQIARFMFQKDFKNVVSYRILRSIVWYLFTPPEPNESGKRVTPLSVAPDKARIETFMKEENWESVVRECEASLVNELERGGFSFCLDIQRFLSTALQQLIDKAKKGDDKTETEAYERLHRLILYETAMLVGCFPSITEIVYSNQVPFADNQTKKWIEDAVKPIFMADRAAQQSRTLPDQGKEAVSEIDEDFRKAEELLLKQRLEEALELMQKGIDLEPTRRGRFQRRLNLASLCLDAAQPSIARPILEHLDVEIEHFSLDDWEPNLCVQVWKYLQRCYQELMPQQQENNGFYQEKANRIFEKICRLDIRVARTLSG